MEVVLKNVKEKDLAVLKSLAEALGFQIEGPRENQYDPEFVKEVLQAEKDIKEGKGTPVTLEELDQLWK
ncbi:MAG: hypothetical protein EAS48_06655 [Chryseobacterium sp.]|nr:MAG: hypothetical protein EAS48_06655 [Chryseobacterium sp.]